MQEWIQVNRRLCIKVTAVILIISVTFAVYFMKRNHDQQDWVSLQMDAPIEQEAAAGEEPISLQTESSTIVVDIAGEVLNPSVYELEAGSRVYDGILAAGGLKKSADTRFLNLAAPLVDGTKVHVPNTEEISTEQGNRQDTSTRYTDEIYIAVDPLGVTEEAGSSASSVINLNTADSSALQQLPRIGPATAEKIIEYRNQFGQFKKKEELMNVSGIGDKTYEALKNLITVE